MKGSETAPLPACCTGHGVPVSRRQLFPLGGALAAGMGFGWTTPCAAGLDQAGGPAVHRFDMADVSLLEGPFLAAQRRAEAYILSLDPDRLLHNFRANAGLRPRAPVYGGWESEAEWADIHCQGHTLGHYLSACALMYRATGEAVFRRRIEYVVDELAACQAASGHGLLCAFPEGAQLVARFIAGEKISGVPWYTLHKLFAGLRDASELAASVKAYSVLIALADWAVLATQGLDDARFEAMLAVEHGGMNEVFADLFRATGRADYAVMARRFSHKALLEPLAQGQDPLDGLHANTQIPKVVGFQRVHAVLGDTSYGRAAQNFWENVVNRRSYATGGHGDGEHFFAPGQMASHVFSAKGSETCGIYNMLKLTLGLFQAQPHSAYADFYEAALFNGILGSQDPDSGMVTYFQGQRPGYRKLYGTPFNSFWCCTGSGMENHAKYREAIYFHRNDTLIVNLFMASTLRWKAQAAELTQTTRFPQEAGTRLQWTLNRPKTLNLRLRHPRWSPSVTVHVNGAQVPCATDADGYLSIRRLWRDGDVVDVALDLAVAAPPLPYAPQIAAFTFGPLVLAADLGDGGIKQGEDIVINERKYGVYCDAPISLPRLAASPQESAGQVKRQGGALAFTVSAEDGSLVRLVPYASIAHQHYITYWPSVV